MIYVEQRQRVGGSAAFSVGLHGALFGAFLLYKVMHPGQKELVITEVDFVDLTPKAVEAAPEPAQRAPSRIRDFIRLALPTLKPAAVQDVKEMAAPKDIQQMAQLPQVKTLVDRSNPLTRNTPALSLNDKSMARLPTGSLGEVAPTAVSASVSKLETIAPEKALDLSAVGRSAVRVAGPSIRVDTSAPAPSGGRMRDLGAAVAVPTAAAGAQVREVGIKLDDGAAPARRGSLGGSLPVGYGRGSGLTLSDRPMARGGGRQVLAPTPAAPPPQAPAAPAEAKSKSSGMDISGPLAGRKVLAAGMPAYPEWARAKGVQADVLIRFFVNPEGTVLERMIIERTSGYKELDDLCMAALEKMVFAPLPPGRTEDQWGIITFRFRLK